MEFWNRPLTPLSFLERSALVFGDRVAVVDGDQRFSYDDLADRARHLAGGLAGIGVEPGDRVAVLAPNDHVLLESHYGIPWSGGVLVALNTRLHPREMAYIISHAGAEVLVAAASFAEAVDQITAEVDGPLRVVMAGGSDDVYEDLLAGAPPLARAVGDETDLISLNYTSGTTGRPKGVMYHHRGAYLQALAMAFHSGLDAGSGFLWTLPMFHCNGWCFTWAVTAAGGTHLCLHSIDPAEVWEQIRGGEVTHFNAAPTVLTMLAHHEAAAQAPHPIRVATGGAPPSPTLLEEMAALGIDITHLYGLTETFGPITICEWRPEWDDLSIPEQARIKARQGVGNVVSARMRVVDSDGADVPADGATLGEVAVAGNNLMRGYYRDAQATAEAVPDDWFRTGDLAVMHPDGYVELKDRAKDVIISGGENIASIEVEQAIVTHGSVSEAAVVGAPHPTWDEAPVAFVALKPGREMTPEEVTEHVRARLAGFKSPKAVVFGALPKTSTGKVQKYVLRERAKDLFAAAPDGTQDGD